MTHLLDYVTQIIAIPHEVTSCMSSVLIEPAVSVTLYPPPCIFAARSVSPVCCECRGRLPALALIPLSLSLRPASDQ